MVLSLVSHEAVEGLPGSRCTKFGLSSVTQKKNERKRKKKKQVLHGRNPFLVDPLIPLQPFQPQDEALSN